MERLAPKVVADKDHVRGGFAMGKGLILWMLGVPGIVVLALLFTHVI
jgi:hypothetical protein